MKYILCISLSILVFNIANASIKNNYQYNSLDIPESIVKNQYISNEAVTIYPELDDISLSDPRIKSVVDYLREHGSGVSIVFFNVNNLRYIKKLIALFNEQNIATDLPQLSKTKNLVEFNLIKIYVIEDKNDVNQPNSKPLK